MIYIAFSYFAINKSLIKTKKEIMISVGGGRKDQDKNKEGCLKTTLSMKGQVKGSLKQTNTSSKEHVMTIIGRNPKLGTAIYNKTIKQLHTVCWGSVSKSGVV